MGNQEYWQILAPWYLDPKSIYSCSYDLHIHLIVIASSCTIPFLVSTLIFNSLFPSTHSLSAISTNFLIPMICRCHFWGNKNVCWSLMSCPYEFLNAIFVIWETKMLWRVFFFFFNCRATIQNIRLYCIYEGSLFFLYFLSCSFADVLLPTRGNNFRVRNRNKALQNKGERDYRNKDNLHKPRKE